MNRKLISMVSLTCTLFVGACSSGDGNGDAGGDGSFPGDAGADVTVEDTGVDSTMPADTGAPDSAATDAGADADAATDAASDAAADSGLPAPGTPCNMPNQTQKQVCGICGSQLRACLPDGDGGYVWGSWGFCQGQVVNGCDPNQQYPDLDCGNCGKKKQVCLSNCSFDLTQQCQEPPNACKPQTVDFQIGLSCDAGGRERVCDQSCQFGPWSSCKACPSAASIPALNQTLTTTINLPANPKLARLISGACPTTLSGTSTSYNYTSFSNVTNKTAKLSIWHSKNPNGSYIDTVISVYVKDCPLPPDDNDQTARKACDVRVNDTCYDSNGTPTPCVSSWAGLMVGDGYQVTLLPGKSVVVYSAAYFSSDSGNLDLNVRTDSLQ